MRGVAVKFPAAFGAARAVATTGADGAVWWGCWVAGESGDGGRGSAREERDGEGFGTGGSEYYVASCEGWGG